MQKESNILDPSFFVLKSRTHLFNSERVTCLTVLERKEKRYCS